VRSLRARRLSGELLSFMRCLFVLIAW